MNIVTATFSSGCRQVAADEKLWQWDQGQILQIVGLDLPDAYQVEFSNQPVRGSAAPMIGGTDGVEIPDVYLTTGKPVYAFLVLHAGEDDRETEYKITIPVNARPQPTDVQPTPEQQDVIDQLIAALNAGVEKAEDAAAAAEEARDKMPRIVDGTWRVYNAVTESWEDTGIQAEGQDGVGISGAVINADYTLTLTFSDGTSYTTPPIRGAQGERGPIGPTPVISIGTVTTGAAGSQAEATMTGTPERPVLNLTIPRGDPGEVTQAEFDELAGEVSNQKSAIEDLEALTNRKAGALIDTASGAIASFVPDATVSNLLGVTVDIECVQAGSGDPSPDNVRPISGWDTVGIEAAGVNIFDKSNVSSVHAYFVIGNSSLMSGSQFETVYLPCKPSTTYAIKNTANNRANLAYTNEIPAVGVATFGGTQNSITTGADAKYLVAYVYNSAVDSVTFDDVKNVLQIVVGSAVPNDYHPYAGNRYTIQLGQTVYGGTLDVTNGTLTVDRYYVTLANSARVSYHPEESTPSIWMRYESGKLAKVTGGRAMSNIYRIGGGVAPFIAYYGTEIDIYDARFTDEQTALSLLADFKCVYTLAKPIVITLDPVAIAAIAGQTNNVWADAGNVAVEFAADLKHYIDSKIAAAVAALS